MIRQITFSPTGGTKKVADAISSKEVFVLT